MNRISRFCFLSLFVVSCLCLSSRASAQQGKWQTGMSLGLEMTSMRIGAAIPGNNNTLQELRINNKPGFDLGLVARYRLAPPLYLRFGAGILFQGSDIYFRWDDDDEHVEEFDLISFYAPLVLEYQNDQLPLNPLFFAGINFSYQLPVEDRGIIKLPIQPYDLGAYFGVGTYHTFKRFALRPEISFNLGLTDWLRTPDELRYQQVVKNIHRDLISLRLLFVGP